MKTYTAYQPLSPGETVLLKYYGPVNYKIYYYLSLNIRDRYITSVFTLLLKFPQHVVVGLAWLPLVPVEKAPQDVVEVAVAFKMDLGNACYCWPLLSCGTVDP